MKWMAIVVAMVALTGCDNQPVATAHSSNPQVPVSLLFEHDGCRVYRFNDGGRNHYYVRCNGGAQSTMSTESCGKNCIRTVGIQTLN